MPYRFPGPVTMTNAEAALAACVAAIDAGETTLEADALVRSDSSAVAVLIAARRHAAARGGALTVSGVPAAVGSLARLYGVDSFVA